MSMISPGGKRVRGAIFRNLKHEYHRTSNTYRAQTSCPRLYGHPCILFEIWVVEIEINSFSQKVKNDDFFKFVTWTSEERYYIGSWNFQQNLIYIMSICGWNLWSKYSTLFFRVFWLVGSQWNSYFLHRELENYNLCANEFQIIVRVYPESFRSLNHPRQKSIVL